MGTERVPDVWRQLPAYLFTRHFVKKLLQLSLYTILNVLRFSLSSNLKHLRYPWEASKITEILSALHPLAVSDGSSFAIPREEVFPGNGRQQNFAFM